MTNKLQIISDLGLFFIDIVFKVGNIKKLTIFNQKVLKFLSKISIQIHVIMFYVT